MDEMGIAVEVDKVMGKEIDLLRFSDGIKDNNFHESGKEEKKKRRMGKE